MKQLSSISFWVSCLLLLAGMTACNDDITGSGEDLKGPDIEVSPVMVSFNDTQTATVSVSYPGPWKAELSEGCTWCTIDKQSGEGDGEIVVTLNPNHSSELLTAKLTIRAVDSPILLKTVQLMCSGDNFYVDPLLVVYGLGDDMTQEVKVNCKGKWTAKLSDDCTWCTLDKTSGTGEETLYITSHMSLNPANVADAKLTITPESNPNQAVTIDVTYQEKYLHGSCITLNKATKGNGINLIVTGDAFTEADMGKGGRWEDVMNRSLEAIFRFEPYKSFREYFNVYAVTAVSDTRQFSNNTPSDTFYRIYYVNGGNPSMSMSNSDFCIEHTPAKDVDLADLSILVVLNDDKYAGMASVGSPSVGLAAVWETGQNPIIKPENMFATIIAHEFLGHAFGHLADEYYTANEAITEEQIARYNTAKQASGHWQNVEFTDDPDKFFNIYWKQMLEMKYPGVDVIQGGMYCGIGVWRSSDNAMMNDQVLSPYFSPVQREIIYRRIHELAGIPYSFDNFVEWDKRNL